MIFMKIMEIDDFQKPAKITNIDKIMILSFLAYFAKNVKNDDFWTIFWGPKMVIFGPQK